MNRVTHAMRRQKWMAIVQECNSSGMKKKDWLAEHNIDPKKFYRWQRRLQMEVGTDIVMTQSSQKPVPAEPTPSFGILKKPETVTVPYHPSVTLHKGDVHVEIDEDISDEFLLRIVKAVSHV